MSDHQTTLPIYDPRVDALSREPWFQEAYEAVHRAVQTLQMQGFTGTINVSGGTLHVR